MMPPTLFFVALAIIVASLAVAWSKRFLATGAIIIGNVLVFLLQFTTPAIDRWLMLVPAELVAGEPLAMVQVLTSMFSHGGPLHLIMNMLVLFILGMPFEERIGARKFVVAYLATGVLAVGGHLAAVGASHNPVVGASGAVYGILGAFAAAYPNVVVPIPVPVLLFAIFVRMRVWVGAVVLGLLGYVMMFAFTSNVAHGAHIGGLVGGLLVGALLIRRTAVQERPQPVDLRLLGQFAPDPSTQDALTRMGANADEPAVFQAWLDRFFRTARCPTCNHKVAPHKRGEVVCTQGHRFDVRAKGGSGEASG